MKVDLLCSLLVSLPALALSYKSYHGHQVLRTTKLDRSSAKVLREAMLETELDFWKEPAPGHRADILVSDDNMSSVRKFLDNLGIGSSVMVEDVQRLIDESRPSERSERRLERTGANYTMDWDDYHPHEVLNEFIQALADVNDFAKIIDIGKSYEGRQMNVLAIEKAGPGAPSIWLEAGIHAREWISPAVAAFIVRELVEDYSEHPDYLDKINWYFLPSANPDGYAYSWEHDRLWRKTRSDHGSILGCKGVDPNRNWGFHYGESGVSHNKCSETYCGPEAFSEVETRNIRDFVMTLDPVPVLGHCFHSYSQLWLWPYGYDYNAVPDNYEEIRQLAIDASDALFKVHGTVFDPINSADLYPAAGASDDWYKGVLGTRFSFTTELRDTGLHGFVLPKEQIIPSGEEMWAGFEVVINRIIELESEY